MEGAAEPAFTPTAVVSQPVGASDLHPHQNHLGLLMNSRGAGRLSAYACCWFHAYDGVPGVICV